MRNFLLFIIIGVLNSTLGFSQDVNIKIGIRDSIQSKNLNENRPFIVNLPKDYETSNKTYPVLYVLDGLQSNLIEAINVTNKLGTEMIIVAIPNTDRNRDMMPLSTSTYEVDNPKAENFLSFIGNELIPDIEKNYRTNGTRTIRGRSLSGLFVMYAFLEKPELFDNYIGNSAGWYADMEYYFGALTDKSFKTKTNLMAKSYLLLTL